MRRKIPTSRHAQPDNTTVANPKRRLIPIKQAGYIVLAFGLLVASAMLFFVEPELSRPFFAQPFNIYRVSIMSLAIIFLLMASTNGWLKSPDRNVCSTKLAKNLRILSWGMPVLAILIVIMQLLAPEFAVNLIRKESWPFYRTGIFIKVALQLVGIVMFVMIARKYAAKHNWLAMATAILIALVLFVMAGEELSWGQRIFGWATPELFTNINEQSETNLHNLATQVFQNTLYFGGWLLLIGLAFWHNSLESILKQFKPISFLADWLPPLSFVLIFAPAFGFCDPLHSETGVYYGSNLFIVIATAIILIAMCIKYVHTRNNAMVKQTLFVLVAYLIVLISNLFFSTVWDANSGAVTEYLEVFISIGLMMWSIAINSTISQTNAQSAIRMARSND